MNKPDGDYLGDSTLASGANSTLVNLPSLPVTGTSTVLFYPTYAPTWQGQLALDTGAPVSINGSTVAVATTVAGETRRYRFSGTAGQGITVGITGLAYSPSSSSASTVKVYSPAGTLTNIATMSCFTAGACSTVISSLPSTGTYSIVISPPSGTTSINGGALGISSP